MESRDQKLYSVNHQIEELEKQKKELKKQLVNETIQQTVEWFSTENSKMPLTKNEFETMLKGFYWDIKEILEN